MFLSSFLEKNYWFFGFKSRLYEWLAPEAYLYTLEQALECVPRDSGKVWLDAGCGSGILIKYIKDRLLAGDRYFGVDLLEAGLQIARQKAEAENVSHRSLFIKSDLTDSTPFQDESIDVIFAHFSIYTISDPQKRIKVFQRMKSALRPGGLMVLVSPSRGYSGSRIIKSSEEILKRRPGAKPLWLSRWLLHPLALYFGLKFIEFQIKKDSWHGYQLDELCEEIRAGGLQIKSTESVYAQSAFLIVAH